MLTVINPENGHGHLAFGLAVPVLLGPRNKHGPKHYLAAVERAMAVRLGADLSYGGFTCKNPLHPYWETLSNDHLYTLPELAGWLGDLNDYRLPVRRAIGLGRNVETFEAVSRWAYRGIREHKAAGGTLEHMAARMHRQRGGVHGRAARAGAGPLGVSIDRAKRGQVDLGTSHRRMVLNETGGPRPGQRSEPPGGRGGAQRAYSDACGFRDDLGGNPGRDRREPRHCRSCAPGGPRAGKGGVSRTRSGCKRSGGIRVRLGGG